MHVHKTETLNLQRHRRPKRFLFFLLLMCPDRSLYQDRYCTREQLPQPHPSMRSIEHFLQQIKQSLPRINPYVSPLSCNSHNNKYNNQYIWTQLHEGTSRNNRKTHQSGCLFSIHTFANIIFSFSYLISSKFKVLVVMYCIMWCGKLDRTRNLNPFMIVSLLW